MKSHKGPHKCSGAFRWGTIGLCLTIVLVVIQALGRPSYAQTPPELPGYTVNITAGYSSLQGATASNAAFSSFAFPIKTLYLGTVLGTMSLAARADDFYNTAPGANILLGGVEQRFQFSSAGLFNGAVFQPFVNEMVGATRNGCVATSNCAAGVSSATKFAFKFGGGLDMPLSSNVVARLFEVDYIRSTLLPQNHLTVSNFAQVTTGIGFKF